MTVSWKNCFRVGLTALLLFLCVYYWGAVSRFLGTLIKALWPLILGLIIAYVLNILMSFYERHYFTKKPESKSRRPVCLLGAILTLFAIVALVIRLVVPELISCVAFLASEVPPAIEKLLANPWVSETLPENLLEGLSTIDWKEYINKLVQTIGSGLGSAAGAVINAVTSVVSAVVTFAIGLIFSIYLMYGRDTLQGQANRLMRLYLPSSWVEKLMHWLSVFNDSFHRFIVGQCTEAVILGVLCILGMLIFRFPYAMMIGTLVGFTALIPIAGAYIGAIVGAVMILTVSPLKSLLFLLFIIVLQQLEGNLIYPKVIGKSIGLPSLWVLAAITVGGSLMGVMGMLVGVPVVAALYRLLKEDMDMRDAGAREKNKLKSPKTPDKDNLPDC